VAIIPPGPCLHTASSCLPAGGAPGRGAANRANSSRLFGIASGGVLQAALLPGRRCALTAPFQPCLILPGGRPSAVCFLFHFPSGFPARPLTGTLPCDVRTFLPPVTQGSPAGDHPIHPGKKTLPQGNGTRQGFLEGGDGGGFNEGTGIPTIAICLAPEGLIPL
jgi:hypothetical protein